MRDARVCVQDAWNGTKLDIEKPMMKKEDTSRESPQFKPKRCEHRKANAIQTTCYEHKNVIKTNYSQMRRFKSNNKNRLNFILSL